MSEMVERIGWIFCQNNTEYCGSDRGGYRDCIAGEKCQCRAAARAAIAAMREPSEEMIDAACRTELVPNELYVIPVWQAMIDEAIRE